MRHVDVPQACLLDSDNVEGSGNLVKGPLKLAHPAVVSCELASPVDREKANKLMRPPKVGSLYEGREMEFPTPTQKFKSFKTDTHCTAPFKQGPTTK